MNNSSLVSKECPNNCKIHRSWAPTHMLSPTKQFPLRRYLVVVLKFLLSLLFQWLKPCLEALPHLPCLMTTANSTQDMVKSLSTTPLEMQENYSCHVN